MYYTYAHSAVYVFSLGNLSHVGQSTDHLLLLTSTLVPIIESMIQVMCIVVGIMMSYGPYIPTIASQPSSKSPRSRYLKPSANLHSIDIVRRGKRTVLLHEHSTHLLTI